MVVIVDVLSFSTAVDVAVGRGAAVIPFPYADARDAEAAARRHGAVSAVKRADMTPETPFSLSPRSLAGLSSGAKLLLPSPNGSALTAIAASAPQTRVVVACFRNARAVAGYAARSARGGAIAVIAAGERWPDGSLRPAVEDDLGAGAVIEALGDIDASPEAAVTASTFSLVGDRLSELLARCVSGVELVTAGYRDDVDVAAAVNVSTAVPVLGHDGVIANATAADTALRYAAPES
ncbi:MAG TPA: 2-phosphosulfolactate phosphatase [Candidatus Elarobacter sp.]